MTYRCPICKREGVVWDGRGKYLKCLYNNCGKCWQIDGQKEIPTDYQVSLALRRAYLHF